MNLDFSDDQKLLREQVQRLLKDQCPMDSVRAILESDKTHDAALWKHLANMGLMGTAIPEDLGGQGLGMLELCVVAEEIGRALAPVPFASSVYVAAEALRLCDNDEVKRAYLPRLASGEIIGTYAFSEGAGATTFANAKTTYKDGALSGTKVPVPDGMAASIALIAARDREGDPVLALAELDAKGVTRKNVNTIDPAKKHATVRFRNAPATPVAAGDEARQLMGRVLDRAAVLFAFEQLGGADAALEMAREYATGRYAFARPIGSFQAIKHKLADIYVRNELARSNCYYAAMTLADRDGDNADLPIAAATARISASDAFTFAAQENVQAHGGIGFTWESDCQFFYRRARLLSLSLGALRRWKERLVSLLEMRNVA